MKKPILILAALAAVILGSTFPGLAAKLEARIDVSSQTMTVKKYGRVIHRWKVSTARRGYVTPRGSWRPTRLHKMWYSRKYDMSPMPYSVFYHRGYAIHGSYETRSLGRPASHGCVRLHPADAQKLFDLVVTVGPENTAITVRR